MRLFVAICFDAAAIAALRRAQDDLRKYASRGNFTQPQNFHLTLEFLGEQPDPASAAQAVRSLASPPFTLCIRGTGRFGDVAWLGVQRSAELLGVHSELCAALQKCGFTTENRPYTPHLTLAREVVFNDYSLFLNTAPKIDYPVHSVSLMKSERSAGRLFYTELCRKELNCE